jgi:hypothetical protein
MQSTGFDLAYLLSSSLAPAQEQILSYLRPVEFLDLSLVSKAVNGAIKGDLNTVRTWTY